MAKTLNEMADSLKAFLIDNQPNEIKNNPGAPRYNNLKLTMNISDATPHVIINVAMSEAIFNITSGERLNGGLGPEERFVMRWFARASVLPDLLEIWNDKKRNRGKAVGGADED